MSPLTTTGMRTASLTLRTRRQSASPLKNWQRVRACTVSSCTPAASARRASSGALRLAWSQPSRIFSVTGTLTAPTTASIRRRGMIEVAHQRGARKLARHFAGRAAHVDIDDVGAERLGHARAFAHPARFAAGKLYDERLAVAALGLAPRVVLLGDEMLAGDHLGDDQAGPEACARRRKARSVTPDMGASNTALGSACGPMRTGATMA